MCREQENQIKQLSQQNREITANLVQRIKELGIIQYIQGFDVIDAVQHELGLILDHSLDKFE